MFKTLQKIGKSFMLPIAILPAAGLPAKRSPLSPKNASSC